MDAYELDDLKHPTFYDRMADRADIERKRAKEDGIKVMGGCDNTIRNLELLSVNLPTPVVGEPKEARRGPSQDKLQSDKENL